MAYLVPEHGDHPRVAIEKTHQVQHNDIVIVGSDGLFDNLDANQIMEILLPSIGSDDIIIKPDEIAKALAEKAWRYGHDQTYDSPFARRAKARGYYYIGGKLDDTTVIVGQVVIVSRPKDQDL